VSALLAQNAKVHRGPAAKRSPRLRSLLSGAPRPVPVRDLVVEAAFVARQGVRSVGAADDDELGGEGPQPADAPDRGDRLVGVENAQRGTVELPVQRGLGDGAEVLGLPSGQVEVEGSQLLREGNAPSSPCRATRSSRRPAAWVMRTRWDSTAQAAAL
jgi:hypothetical protein